MSLDASLLPRTIQNTSEDYLKSPYDMVTYNAGSFHLLCVLGDNLVKDLLSLLELSHLVQGDAVTCPQSRWGGEEEEEKESHEH